MADTTQYKIRISEALIARLETMAREYTRKSGNQIAAEIVEQYADFWEQAELARQDVIQQQRVGLEGVYARGKTSRREIEKVLKDAQSRTKKNR
jgi:hypothetical protein